MAARLGGICRLRIEDIDPIRSKPELAEAIVDDLAWLGLQYPKPVRHQSRHMGEYRAVLDRLAGRELVYPCFCSRGTIRAAVQARATPVPSDPDGTPLYPGTCRTLDRREALRRRELGEPHTWRLDMARALSVALAEGPIGYTAFEGDAETAVEVDPSLWGDAVVARRDVPTSYHLAVVHDDAAEGITHVVRGVDLEAATGLHVLLQRLLGLPTPRYHHHALIRDGDGRKLAKSEGAPSLASLRQEGLDPSRIRAWLGL
jgi:glutamyl-Q tRNA(Asp) synthetase